MASSSCIAGVDIRFRIERLVTAVDTEKLGWFETNFMIEYAPNVTRGAKLWGA